MIRPLRKAVQGILRMVMRLLPPSAPWRLFHLAREADERWTRRALEYLLEAELPARPLGAAFEENYFAGVTDRHAYPWFLEGVPGDRRALLDEIPSETTPRERDFLYQFLRTHWSGRGDVFEVGPFLGGTTRAMALGMLANPRCSDEARLRTFDRFEAYHTRDELLAILAPYFERAAVPEEERERYLASDDFLGVFKRVHQGHAYAERIDAKGQVLPDTPEEAGTLPNLLRLEEEDRFEVAFIDGCKSWYGTKYCMQQLARAMRVGDYILFQDYGWYTCFWLPCFTGLFPDVFRLLSHVDSTYCFQLAAPLDAEHISNVFPDHPRHLGPDRLDEMLLGLAEAARQRADRRGILALTLQRAAAMAYLGLTQEAIRIIEGIDLEGDGCGFEGLVRQARRCPTYFPPSEGGRVYLDPPPAEPPPTS